MTTEDIIYLAGLFDGEGCVAVDYVRKEGLYPSTRLAVSVVNTDYPIMCWLVDTFGGCLKELNRYKKNHSKIWS